MHAAALTAAIAALLEGVSAQGPWPRAGKLSAAYRDGRTSARHRQRRWTPWPMLVARMPATYAATRAVFARVAEAMPDFAPASLLDVGAGTGTAAGRRATLAGARGRHHAGAQSGVPRPGARGLMPDGAGSFAGDLGADKPHADLVMASYVLAELPESGGGRDRAAICGAAAAQMLVLVEPGTPAGFARIRAARAALIEAGAHVAAPCTHDKCLSDDGQRLVPFLPAPAALARSHDRQGRARAVRG